MVKAVLDSNVIVSALLVSQGKPAQIIGYARSGVFRCVLSNEILQEVRRIVHRKHIQKKYNLPEEKIEELLGALQEISMWVTIQAVENIITNDPPDNLVLACAIEGNADYLVSGNLHFLNLRKHRNVKMVSPAEFLDILAKL